MVVVRALEANSEGVRPWLFDYIPYPSERRTYAVPPGLGQVVGARRMLCNLIPPLCVIWRLKES